MRRLLLTMALGAALALATFAGWRWLARTSQTQVHRVNQ